MGLAVEWETSFKRTLFKLPMVLLRTQKETDTKAS